MTRTQTRRQLEMLHLVKQYKRVHGTDEIDLDSAAAWAHSNGLWKPPEIDPLRILRREISRALRGEYYLDPQNREVRKNHPVVDRETGKVTWIDHSTAPPDKMSLSFTHHRKRVLGECKQLSLDFDSYNENNQFGVTLEPIDFDFTKDIEESKLPAHYVLTDEPGMLV